jgi:A/G-specific adenine glycosylase
VKPRELQRALLSWYDVHKRPLPFRSGVTPYRTWVSEIMAQQTTMAVVVPAFTRFLARFPDIKTLADADEAEVLKMWAGLGYYTRARNLLRAAQTIRDSHGGIFPNEFSAVVGLPGIGRYTAGAILSIAFGKPVPVLDGNVARVFSRLFAIEEDVKAPATVKALWARAAELVDAARPGDWNQALMELGATVCAPESPRCGECPLAKACTAKARGIQDRLPVTGAKRAAVDLAWTCLWIERGGRVLLWRRDESERFLRGHWGLPEARHVPVSPGALLKTVRHTITHHRITLRVRRAQAPASLPKGAEWVLRARLRERLVSSLWLKSLVVQ